MKKILLLISVSILSLTNSKSQTFDTLATFQIPDQLALGVAFDYVNNYYVISSGGQSNTVVSDNYFLRYDLNFNLVDSVLEPQGTTSGFGIRDLAFDGTYILGSYDADVQQFDPTTLTSASSFPGYNNPNRGLAVDTDGTVYSTNFTGGPLAHFDQSATFLDSCSRISLVGNAPYGIAVERWTNPGTPRIWLNTPSTAGAGLFLTRYDYANCAIDTNVDLSALVPAYADVTTTTSGGLDIIHNHPNYPNKIIALVLGQNNPTAFVMLVDMTPVNTGINQVNGNSFNVDVYPNPVQDILNVNINGLNNQTQKVEIINALGETVKSITTSAEQNLLNVTSIEKGIYFLRVTSDDTVVSLKKVSIQ